MLRVPVIIKAVDHQLSRNLMINEWIGINGVFSQTIRWKRKPIWLPPAKSKLFRVPERQRVPEEERVEILRIYNNYRTYRKSIREFLIQEVKASQVHFDEESIRKAEEEDFIECTKINDEWNKGAAKMRELRLAEEKALFKADVLKRKEEKKRNEEERLREIEEQVRRVKEEAKTFVTRENIDQVIEEVLANVVDYNAAIDMSGNRITVLPTDPPAEMTAANS